MVVSCVVRLIPEQLVEGRFVGEVEDVDRGTVTTVRDLDELAAALRRSAREPREG
jgi:hypothetical protein